MKLCIRNKLLVLLLILTIIPLSVLGYLAFTDIKDMGSTSLEDVNLIGDLAIEESTTALNSLGEYIIQQKAIDVAKQMEIYMLANPELTVAELQQDEYFKAIAVQPVGLTGYTAITDSNTLICRFHASDKIVNMDLHNLESQLPGFWSVMSQSEGGQEISGYYEWEESDGSLSQKYMYIKTTDASTADGVKLGISATTYINEFSAPALATKETIDVKVEEISERINIATNNVKKEAIYIIVIILITVIATAFIFSRSLTNPLKELTQAANNVADGNLNAPLPEIKSEDEIKELSDAMKLLVGAVKFLKEGKHKK